MTLTEARARTRAAVEARVAPRPPAARPSWGHAECLERDGVVTGKEIARMQARKPSVQVAVLGRDGDGIRVVAYVVVDTRVPAVGSAVLELLDGVEEALRTLPGAGRPLLEVRTQALFDADMMTGTGAALWAVTAAWPDLAAAPDGSAGSGGLIAAANELLAPAVDAALGLADVDEQDAAAAAARERRRGMTELDRRRCALEGPLPCAEVRHGDGAVERHGAGSGRALWPAGDPGRPLGRAPAPGQSLARQAVRGTRTWTAVITLWAGTEGQVDAALTILIRLLPRRWTWAGQQNLVTVGDLGGPVYVPARGACRASVAVTLAAAALAGEPETIRTLTGSVSVRPCPEE